MAQHEEFNLDRHVSMQHMIDPTGRKWEIHGNRETHLVHARPNPDRKDAVIPKEFDGQWTNPSVLKERIHDWLNKQWNMAEEKQRRAALKSGRGVLTDMLEASEELLKKKTPEESLEELPEEIKQELGEMIETDRAREAREAREAEEAEAVKKKVSKKKVTKKVTAKK